MAKKIIAMANHKGGVGKTTSVAAIGAELAKRGLRTLLIDLDAQQNLTSSFVKETDVKTSIYDSLLGRESLPVIQVRENLYLCPSSIELAEVDTELSTKLARESILRRLLEGVKDDFDYILLDCPPSLGIITTNALTAATDIYIPLTAEALPLRGLTMLDRRVKEVKESLNPALQVSGVFITRYNNRNLNNIVLDTIRERYGDKVFSTRIRENISLAESPLTRKVIFDYAPSSNGAKDYESLTEEILRRE